MAIVSKLEEQLDIPKKVRIHWTGCPNSCAQARPAPRQHACPATPLCHASCADMGSEQLHPYCLHVEVLMYSASEYLLLGGTFGEGGKSTAKGCFEGYDT